MTISWADALKAAIERSRNLDTRVFDCCPLCTRALSSRRCYACPAGGVDGLMNARTKALIGSHACGHWSVAIHEGNRTALHRARQLEAYIRKHPRKWMHMEPDALAREVKKETP